MSSHASVVRDREGLERVLATIESTASSDATALDLPTLEATNLHTVSLLLATAALQREESRGCHRRSDFATPDTAFAQPQILRILDGQIELRAGAMADA
jgi:aspartate oxidase